jgi:hypothetical protein
MPWQERKVSALQGMGLPSTSVNLTHNVFPVIPNINCSYSEDIRVYYLQATAQI